MAAARNVRVRLVGADGSELRSVSLKDSEIAVSSIEIEADTVVDLILVFDQQEQQVLASGPDAGVNVQAESAPVPEPAKPMPTPEPPQSATQEPLVAQPFPDLPETPNYTSRTRERMREAATSERWDVPLGETRAKPTPDHARQSMPPPVVPAAPPPQAPPAAAPPPPAAPPVEDAPAPVPKEKKLLSLQARRAAITRNAMVGMNEEEKKAYRAKAKKESRARSRAKDPEDRESFANPGRYKNQHSYKAPKGPGVHGGRWAKKPVDLPPSDQAPPEPPPVEPPPPSPEPPPAPVSNELKAHGPTRPGLVVNGTSVPKSSPTLDAIHAWVRGESPYSPVVMTPIYKDPITVAEAIADANSQPMSRRRRRGRGRRKRRRR
jgi:hypothetical protein